MHDRLPTTLWLCCLLATVVAGQELRPLESVDLTVNGGFEEGVDGPAGWTVPPTSVEGVERAWETDRPRSGRRCLRIESRYQEDRPWFPWQQRIDGIRAGQVYRLSAWVRTVGLQRGAVVALHFQDDTGKTIDMGQGLRVPRDAPEWTAITREVTAPRGAVRASLLLSMHGVGQVWFDDVRVERPLTPTVTPFAAARVYPVVKASGPVTLDGGNRDWEGVPRTRVASAAEVSQAQAVVEDREVWKGPDDLSFDFAMQHDGTNLYLLISVRDEVRKTQRPYWQGDSVQLAIDPLYARSAKGFGPSDCALGIRLEKGPEAVVIEHAPEGSGLTSADLGVGRREGDGWYMIELAIPWAKLGLRSPQHNRRLGFTMIVNDNDGAGRKWAEWTPGIARGKRPADFGTLLLLTDDDLGLSLEPDARPLRDTDPATFYADLVSVAKTERTVPLVLTVDDGGPGIEDRREIAVGPGLNRIPLAYAAGSLAAGRHRLQVAADGLQIRIEVEVEPVQAIVDEVAERLARLAPKVERLAGLVERGRDAGLDVALPDVALATAECFQAWIPADVSRRGDEALARREAERLEPLVDRAIAEVERTLAAPAEHPAITPPNPVDAALRDGSWYVGERPLFSIGFCSVRDQSYDLLRRFGTNLVGFSASPRWLCPDGPEPDRQRIRDTVVDGIRQAAAAGFVSDILFGQNLPDWLLRQQPDIAAADGHFCYYDIDHPVARRQVTATMEAVAAAVRDLPVVSYDLWNEASYTRMSPRGVASFRAAMKRLYGSIERLNAAWGTDFGGFDGVRPPDRDPTQAAAYADWCRWNDARVTGWFAAMREAVRRGDPEAATHVKIGNEITISGSKTRRGPRTRTVSGHYHGLDRWALAQLCEIHGCDTRPTPLSDTYAFAWRYPGMAFDLQRSMAPGKPIFDSEWHGIQTVYFEDSDIPAEHLRAALWHSYLHGLDANLIWWWSRIGAAPKQQWFSGSLCAQPQLLDAFGRNSVIVQRLAREIVAFTDQTPRVRLLYSKPSAILDIGHLDSLGEAYEALSWCGLPLGFVTEEVLLAGVEECDLLVVPGARHASPGVREAVAKVASAGTTVVLLGDDCLTLTPHGQAMERLVVLQATRVDVADLPAAVERAGLAPRIRCVGPDGASSKPVEFRTATLDGRRLGYLLGLGKQPAKVRVESDGRPARWRSLLTGERHEGAVTMDPLAFDLVEFEER